MHFLEFVRCSRRKELSFHSHLNPLLSSGTLRDGSTPCEALRRRCLGRPITLHTACLARLLSVARAPFGSVLPDLLFAKVGSILAHRSLVFLGPPSIICLPKFDLLSPERRGSEERGRPVEKNIQCTGFLNSCSLVLKSPSSCDFLPLLHRAAEAELCAQMHTCKYAHTQTLCTLCVHTCSIR